jgi:hypothetical protein
VRIASALLLILGLAGCKSGNQSNDAVRQGVVEYLQKVGINVAGMDINLASVKFNGDKADATVNMGVKGTGTTNMTMAYHLEMKDNKWMVVGKQDSSQHGGGAAMPGAGAMPGAANPHAGGAMPAVPPGGKMPAPEDLPPAGKKK